MTFQMETYDVEYTFTSNALQNLFNYFGYPEPFIQEALMKIFLTLVTTYPTINQRVYLICCKYLSDPLLLIQNPTPIRPAIELFQIYVRINPKWNSEMDNFIIHSLFSLFLVNDLSFFFQEFLSLLAQLFQKHSILAEYCLQFLIKHWPLTHTHKVTFFISAIELCFVHMQFQPKVPLISQALRKLFECIGSDCVCLSYPAFQTLSNPETTKLIQLCSLLEEFKKYLIQAQHSFDENTRAKVQSFEDIILDPEIEVPQNDEKNENERNIIWKQLKEQFEEQ